MYDHDTSNFNFGEDEKFLQNILELKKLTQHLLKNREELNANLKKLDKLVHSLYNEIQKSVNK